MRASPLLRQVGFSEGSGAPQCWSRPHTRQRPHQQVLGFPWLRHPTPGNSKKHANPQTGLPELVVLDTLLNAPGGSAGSAECSNRCHLPQQAAEPSAQQRLDR